MCVPVCFPVPPPRSRMYVCAMQVGGISQLQLSRDTEELERLRAAHGRMEEGHRAEVAALRKVTLSRGVGSVCVYVCSMQCRVCAPPPPPPPETGLVH